MPEIKQIDMEKLEEVKKFFKDVFTREPWNDDWSDEKQLHAYICDLMGNRNSLAFGLFQDGAMVGLCLGSIRHWYSGTEYCVDEFCIRTESQGAGLGTEFMRGIEENMRSRGVTSLFLQTERSVPAYRFYQKNGFTDLKDHVSFAKDL